MMKPLEEIVKPSLLKRLLKERMAISLFVAALLFIQVGLFRTDIVGMNKHDYAIGKMKWKACADMVFAGDSRVQECLSPEAMTAFFPDRQLRNYAFYGTSYHPKYYDAIESVLDPESKHPAVLLGITPNSLTPRNFKINGLKMEMDKYESLTPAVKHIGVPTSLLPMTPSVFLQNLVGKDASEYYRQVHADGWVSVVKPIVPTYSLDEYRRAFTDNYYDDDIVEALLTRVKTWTRKGIAVYGFRPPTTPAMVELESKMSGFEEEHFRQLFETAGGKWIEVDPFGYLSYDGSHLHRDGAIEFSKDIAQKITEWEVATISGNTPENF